MTTHVLSKLLRGRQPRATQRTDQLALLEADPRAGASRSSACSTRPRTTSIRSAAPGARARPGRRRLRGGAGPARGRLRPPDPRAGSVGRDRRRRSGGRGPAPGVVVGRAGRGLGGRAGNGAGEQRRAGRSARSDRRTGPRLEPAPGACRCRRAHAPRPWPSRSRSRSAGWLRSAAGWAATASGPAWPGWAGSPWRPCGSWPRARSCRRCTATKRPQGRSLDLAVRWVPALVDEAELDQLAAAMPGPIVALARADAQRHHPRRPRRGRRRHRHAKPPAGSSCRRRRPSRTPRPPSPRRSSPGSTARRSRRRSPPAPRSPSGSTAGSAR